MSWFCVFLSVILGAVVVSGQDLLSNPVVELTVRPGENVTLYCDCKTSTDVYIVWFRNCSHENQPTFALKTVDVKLVNYSLKNKYLHFNVKWNISTASYDLLINNITEVHLGLYYCGTQEKHLLDKGVYKYVYTYGKSTTRILLGAGDPGPAAPGCGQCWMLLAILCPSSALLLSLLSSLIVYLHCRRTAAKDPRVHQTTPDSRNITQGNQVPEPLLPVPTVSLLTFLVLVFLTSYRKEPSMV
ncbi:unnamed protein product [Lota lota]